MAENKVSDRGKRIIRHRNYVKQEICEFLKTQFERLFSSIASDFIDCYRI